MSMKPLLGNERKRQPPEPLESLLRREGRASQREAMCALGKLTAELRSGARPDIVTRSHPWVATGAAAFAGFMFSSFFRSPFRRPKTVEVKSPPAALSPASGIAALAMAALTRAIPLVAPLFPAILESLFKNVQIKQAAPTRRSENGTQRHRPK